MSELTIVDPLLNTPSELIVEENVLENELLRNKILEDVRGLSRDTRSEMLSSMLRMHQYFEEECGDLDVSLKSEREIQKNTQAWRVILDGASTLTDRVVRLHYKANWETSHGVEVIVLNGNNLLFVGNCGYVSKISQVLSSNKEGFNFASVAQ